LEFEVIVFCLSEKEEGGASFFSVEIVVVFFSGEIIE